MRGTPYKSTAAWRRTAPAEYLGQVKWYVVNRGRLGRHDILGCVHGVLQGHLLPACHEDSPRYVGEGVL